MLAIDFDKVYLYKTGNTLTIKMNITLDDYLAIPNVHMQYSVRDVALTYYNLNYMDSFELELVAVYQDYILSDLGLRVELAEETYGDEFRIAVLLSNVANNPKSAINKAEYTEVGSTYDIPTK